MSQSEQQPSKGRFTVSGWLLIAALFVFVVCAVLSGLGQLEASEALRFVLLALLAVLVAFLFEAVIGALDTRRQGEEVRQKARKKAAEMREALADHRNLHDQVAATAPGAASTCAPHCPPDCPGRTGGPAACSAAHYGRSIDDLAKELAALEFYKLSKSFKDAHKKLRRLNELTQTIANKAVSRKAEDPLVHMQVLHGSLDRLLDELEALVRN